jgi:uncharacterized protein (DUF1501 family)
MGILISRRNFLKASAVLVPALATMPMVFRRTVAASNLESPRTQSSTSGRTLLVVQMAGGNDGLNTIVPYSDGRYYDLRGPVSIPESDVLHLNDEVGFHPSLAEFKKFWDDGMLAIIEGVGYPNQSYSHFESMHIWQTAIGNSTPGKGWLGKYFETLDKSQAKVFHGMAVGKVLPPECSTPHLPIPVVENVSRYQLQNDPSRTIAMLDLYNSSSVRSPYSVLLDETVQTAVSTSQALKEASQGYQSSVEYPTTPFGEGLRLLAKAIVGNLGIKVGHITIGGFDTHATQLGEQAVLLQTFSQGIHAFYQDLKEHGKDHEVTIMTWSEFGRRAKSNASVGTDHGSAAPLFIFGTPVTGGLYGQRPDLGNLDDDNLIFTTDFRRVYATVLEQWLGVPVEAVLGSNDFLPLPIINV